MAKTDPGARFSQPLYKSLLILKTTKCTGMH